VWLKVTEALVKGNYGAASKEKQEIEEGQRGLRKQRKESSMDWTPVYFVHEAPAGSNDATGFWRFRAPSG
jgi:hypothetical protein